MKKALIIDDSNTARTSMAFSLTQRGYNVITAVDGCEGLKMAGEHPDLAVIISDINMPCMNGFELIAQVRKFNATVPIIALSMDEEKGNQAIQAGATAFIIKSSKSSEEIQRFLVLYIK